MKLKIAHLSDPHFGTIKPEVQEALFTIVKELEPDLIVVSGDITQRAHRAQFKAAYDFFKRLAPSPVVVIPGNHDISLYNFLWRLFLPYWKFQHYLKGTLGRKAFMNGVEVLALNSTSRVRIIQGKLNARKLKTQLAQSSKEAVIRIVTFHHPMSCPKQVDVKNLLIGRDQVMKVLEQNNVDLVLGGHIHDPYISLSHESYPDVKRATIIGVAGTCLSWRTRADAPNSFHWIETDTAGTYGPSLCISRYDIQKDCKFRSISKEEFIRQEDSGWQRANFPTKEIFDPGEQVEKKESP